MNADERFYAKVRRSAGCWEWTASVFLNSGYGTFSLGRRNIGAHRAAWILERGPIPAGMSVLHRCDNRLCVRVDHLFLGTHADNMADKIAKGRAGDTAPHNPVRGEAMRVAKLTESRVAEARFRAAQGEASSRLAAEFGVATSTMAAAISGQTWAHVAVPPLASHPRSAETCRNGHTWTEANTYRAAGKRHCRTCRRDVSAGQAAQRKAARDARKAAA